ncbi:MAG: DNA repair protein RadC [Ignavibacteriales bacterium]
MKVKDLPLDDRPREKMFLRGVQSLSDSELIAILLRTGTKGESVIQVALNLLNKFGNISLLANQNAATISKVKGIGKDKAATLLAAFEISRRIESSNKWFAKNKISSPKDVADIFIPLLRDEVKEKFIVVCLNSANKIIKYEIISQGTLNSSLVHAREVFKTAFEHNAANIILIHNHPSGNPEPSNEDKNITKRLVEAGKLLDVSVFDHIIIAGEEYYSFVEKKLI